MLRSAGLTNSLWGQITSCLVGNFFELVSIVLGCPLPASLGASRLQSLEGHNVAKLLRRLAALTPALVCVAVV